MVARRMRRRFLGAKRPTNAASTMSAPPRMRTVEGEAYPSHCCARALGAGKANGSCAASCSETSTAPAPAAAAAAALVCCCCSCCCLANCDGEAGAPQLVGGAGIPRKRDRAVLPFENVSHRIDGVMHRDGADPVTLAAHGGAHRHLLERQHRLLLVGDLAEVRPDAVVEHVLVHR